MHMIFICNFGCVKLNINTWASKHFDQNMFTMGKMFHYSELQIRGGIKDN